MAINDKSPAIGPARKFTEIRPDTTGESDRTLPPQQPTQTQPSVTPNSSLALDDAQSKLLKEQNYTALANNLISNYNMKMNSQRYLQNSLASIGVANSGYGSTAQIGINTTAANNAATALQNYWATQDKINADLATRNDAKQTESDNQLAAFITNYGNGDKAKIDSFFQDYGYKDANGNWTDKFNQLDASRQSYFRSLENASVDTSLQSSDSGIRYGDKLLSDYLGANSIPVYDYEGLKSSKWGAGEGARNTLADGKNGVKTELEMMQAGIEGGQYRSGDVFKLTNKGGNNGGGWSTYVLYYQGKYYRVNEDFYNSYRGGSRYQLWGDKYATKEA